MLRRRMRHAVFMIFALFISSDAWSQDVAPSSVNCDYYRALDAKLNCGPRSYLEKSAIPLCESYLELQNSMTDEIQIFFPSVRVCLQNELQKREADLNCGNLVQAAEQTHVLCYSENNYCSLSWTSKTQLGMLMISRLWSSSVWRRTAREINATCQR